MYIQERFEREEMSKMERNFYNANLKLTNEKKEMLNDIDILIRYINGNKELKSNVKEITEYYTQNRKRVVNIK